MIPLRLPATASTTDAENHLKKWRFRNPNIDNFKWKTEDTMKIFKSLEKSGLLTKDIGETIENVAKKQNSGFLNMLLCTLFVSLSGSLLAGKDVINTESWAVFLMLPYSLTYFEIQKYYQTEPRLICVY